MLSQLLMNMEFCLEFLPSENIPMTAFVGYADFLSNYVVPNIRIIYNPFSSVETIYTLFFCGKLWKTINDNV